MRSADIEVDVSSALGLVRPVSMRGWVKAPRDGLDGGTLVYCLAGGGCSTGYFDLAVPGETDYSMADHFVRAGMLVAALDHPGIGVSDPVDDIFELTPTVVARAHHAALTTLETRLRTGQLAPIPPRPHLRTVGLGHSMGGLIAAVAQARHRSFVALISLGHGGTGLPEVLTEAELQVSGADIAAMEADIVALARHRFAPGSTIPRRQPAHGNFFAPNTPLSIRQAFATQSAALLSSCGLASMIPDSARAERAAVDVPTFIAFGDDDLIVDYADSAAQYSSAPLVDLYILQGSGHCHNLAPTRKLLWNEIVTWIRAGVAVAPS